MKFQFSKNTNVVVVECSPLFHFFVYCIGFFRGGGELVGNFILHKEVVSN